MSHPIMGTLLQDLNNRDTGEKYDSLRQLQDINQQNINYYQNQTLPPNQINQYINPKINQQLPPTQNMNGIYDPEIEDLVKNINDNFPDEIINQTEEESETLDKNNWYDPLLKSPVWIKEILLLVIIFVILSQPFVKDFIGKYVNQINVDDEGKVSFAGVVIYGFILAIIYVSFKKLLIN